MLREFHEALHGQLAATFPTAEVRKHAGEVDVDTVRRHAMRRVNLWATVAHGTGTDDASDTRLRMLVEWAVFVIVGSALELVEDLEGQPRQRRAEPVEVAAFYAEQVLRLAHDNDWALEGCSKARKTDLRFSNLGVGLKPTARGVDKSDLGLFVVWGRQELELGHNILPGKVELGPFAGFDGEIEDQGPSQRRPRIEVRAGLDPSPKALLWAAANSLAARLHHFVERRAA